MQLAVIREAECVGCTKCLKACPVDAIVGASQFMHTVIESECIGCKLCVAPCPMDCIDIIESPIIIDQTEKERRGLLAKKRYQARQARLARQEQLKLPLPTDPLAKSRIKAEIKASVERMQAKRKGITD